MSDEPSQQELQSFTSWKLDLLDAISCDTALQDIDVRVAFRLMQHVNARTRDAHPSLERLAAQIGVSRDTVCGVYVVVALAGQFRYLAARHRVTC